MSESILRSRLQAELPHIAGGIVAALAQLPPETAACAEHVISAGGKRLRPFLTVIFARLLGNHSEGIYRLAACMELLHAATLLHDDVLDNATTRRGRRAAHLLFGVSQAILSGDALLACGNSVVASYGNPLLCSAYSEATMRTAAGEIAEMSALGKPDLSFSAYLEIAKAKTGCLIEQSCAMGAIFAQAAPEGLTCARLFGLNLGLAFQIVDDVLDFAPEEETGKPCGGDLREGKATPPVMLYRQSLSPADRDRFDSGFRAFAGAELERIIAGIRRNLRESLAIADQYLDAAKAALAHFPDCEEKAILLEMAQYVRDRRS